MLADMEAGKERILELLELAQEFGRRFRAKKKEKNVVDFHDLEHFALEILTEPEAECSRRRKLQVQKKTIRCKGKMSGQCAYQAQSRMSSPCSTTKFWWTSTRTATWFRRRLIQCISGERFDRPNVFMVGDVKQSIYKFRLARPELFLEKIQHIRRRSAHQKIELHQNFRSRDHILESINAIFYRIMTEKLGNISYTEDAALHPGAAFEERDGLDELKTELFAGGFVGAAAERDGIPRVR